MKKIIVLSTYCFGKASTNGYCARLLAQALRSQGNQVALVGYGEKTTAIDGTTADGEFVLENISESAPATNKMQVIKNIYQSLCGPVYDKALARRYADFVCQLVEKHNYDAVVSMYFPVVCMLAAKKAKDQFPHLKIFNYELDSASDGIVYKSRLSPLQEKANVRWLTKSYTTFDGVLVMKSHQEHVKSLYGDTLGKKLIVTDLPVLENKLSDKKSDNDKTVFVYAGLLNKSYRSPRVLLDLFSHNKLEDWQLHFFTKGNCENDIALAAKSDSRIIQHGYVSSEVLDESIKNADVLVSIGNAQSKSVPSKIITYMSGGKPIIHFSLQKEDVCNEYLKKYPAALIINAGEDFDESSQKIRQFIEDAKSKEFSFSDLEEAFPMNLPAYSAKAIINML